MQYKKEALIIDLVKANAFALALIIPILLTAGIPYYLIWQEELTAEAFKTFIRENKSRVYWSGPVIFIVIIVGIVVHELIHGLTWSLFAKNGWKSIKFGVLWKMLTPYCHCKEPLTVRHYILGGIMPAVVLGIFPVIISWITGSLALLVFGIFFTIAAAGDFMIIHLLRAEDKNSLVEDHPSEAGCYIYRPV